MGDRAPASAKGKLLQAAAQVVERDGAAHLTLEAVAEEANLSKGGLLYHFPNKRALLAGMVQHLLERAEAKAEQARTELGAEAPQVAAHIVAQQSQSSAEWAMSRAILAAAAEDPSLLDPARDVLSRWFDDAHVEGRYATLLLMAVEGLRFMEMLKLVSLSADQRARLYSQMVELAEVGTP